MHFSLDPTFGADLAGVTIPDWGWNPTTTSGTVGGVATTRVERADNVLAYHDTLRGGANDDLLEHLVDTWIANDFVDVHLDIRLMHEMNFTKRLYIAHSPPERAGQLEASFKTLWRHYVDKLRSYTVAQLGYWPPKWKIAFNPGSTVAALSNPQNPGYTWDRWVETWWPGDSYVDVVSFNIYPKTGQDEDVRNVFAGLDRFSRKHRKPMAIYEMGLDVLVEGDNPAVWTLLADEIRKRSPLRWRTIGFFGAVSDAPANNFDIADTGVPNALAEFRAQFGA